ncbi:unnamed protein product, partial [Prorocentrum cordatum]
MLRACRHGLHSDEATESLDFYFTSTEQSMDYVADRPRPRRKAVVTSGAMQESADDESDVGSSVNVEVNVEEQPTKLYPRSSTASSNAMHDSDQPYEVKVPKKYIKQFLKKELQEAGACMALPIVILMFACFCLGTVGSTSHFKTEQLHSQDYAISFDIEENANFAFAGSIPFEIGRIGWKNIYDVNSVADFWSWLNLGLLPIFFPAARSWDTSESRSNVAAQCESFKSSLEVAPAPGFYGGARTPRTPWGSRRPRAQRPNGHVRGGLLVLQLVASSTEAWLDVLTCGVPELPDCSIDVTASSHAPTPLAESSETDSSDAGMPARPELTAALANTTREGGAAESEGARQCTPRPQAAPPARQSGAPAREGACARPAGVERQGAAERGSRTAVERDGEDIVAEGWSSLLACAGATEGRCRRAHRARPPGLVAFVEATVRAAVGASTGAGADKLTAAAAVAALAEEAQLEGCCDVERGIQVDSAEGDVAAGPDRPCVRGAKQFGKVQHDFDEVAKSGEEPTAESVVEVSPGRHTTGPSPLSSGPICRGVVNQEKAVNLRGEKAVRGAASPSEENVEWKATFEANQAAHARVAAAGECRLTLWRFEHGVLEHSGEGIVLQGPAREIGKDKAKPVDVMGDDEGFSKQRRKKKGAFVKAAARDGMIEAACRLAKVALEGPLDRANAVALDNPLSDAQRLDMARRRGSQVGEAIWRAVAEEMPKEELRGSDTAAAHELAAPPHRALLSAPPAVGAPRAAGGRAPGCRGGPGGAAEARKAARGGGDAGGGGAAALGAEVDDELDDVWADTLGGEVAVGAEAWPCVPVGRRRQLRLAARSALAAPAVLPAASGAVAAGGAELRIQRTLQNQMADVTKTLQNTVANSFQDITKELERQLAPHVQKIEEHTQDLAKIKASSAHLEQSNKQMADQIRELQTTLAHVDSLGRSDAPDMLRLADWDRPADPQLFVANCHKPCAPAAILDSLSQWLEAAKTTKAQITINEKEPSKRFHIHVPGAADGRARALHLTKHLRCESGRWRDFSVRTVEGNDEKLYINPDKNPRAIRQEVQTKKLLSICKETLPGDWWMQRSAGIIHFGTTPIAEVKPQRPDEPPQLSWSPAAKNDLQLNTTAISNQFKALFRAVSDHAIIELKIEPRKETDKNNQSIPSFIFSTKDYKEQLATCLDACDIDQLSPTEQWECVKRQMILAAEGARNAVMRTPIGDNSSNDIEARCMAMRAIARAVWRQDRRLATRLLERAAAGPVHLRVEGSSVALRDAARFEAEVLALSEDGAAEDRAMRLRASQHIAYRERRSRRLRFAPMKVCLAVPLSLSLLAPAALAAGGGVTPVQKVIPRAHGEHACEREEKHAEEVQFAAYKQFCDDTTVEKENAISEAEERIEVLTADIEKRQATAAQLTLEIKDHEADIASWDGDMKAAAKVRSTERAAYSDEHKDDLSESVDALQRAIQILKKQAYDRGQASLVQVQALQSDKLIPDEAKRAIAAFLQQDPQESLLAITAPEAAGYEFQSHGIIEMLAKLLDKFISERTTLEKEELNKKHAHHLTMQDLSAQSDQAKQDVSDKTQLKAKNLEMAADAKADLTETQDTLEADKKYLADLQAQCSQKASDFGSRQQLRAEELEALAKAIQIISSEGVAGSAEKHLPTMVQARAPSFAALRTAAAPSESQARAAAYLQERAEQTGSRVLSSIAARVQEDPFGKVKKMIK